MDPHHLQSVLDAVLDGVIVIDGRGRITQLNSEASRILEISPEKAEGSELEDYFGKEHAVAKLAEQVRSERRGAIADGVVIERRFGSNVDVTVAASPIDIASDDGDEIDLGIVIELRDHTLRSFLREGDAQRDQLQRYGQIAAGIAHEVKNPLGGIRGAAELLRNWATEDRSHGAADLIVREVDRIAALVDELMVFARGDALKLAPVNLHRILDNVLHLLEMDPLSKNISTERVYDPSIPELLADSDRLTQIFLNLSRKALQAMQDIGSGRLHITTRMTLDDRVTDRHGHQVPTVLITIADTGGGIAPETLERLATPFFTTRSDGTGLGLSMAQHWATRHDGSLRIQSQLGEGTTVRVALPLQGPQRS
ncbi:MAG: ATP-binding protein [Myxococcota bacterium]|nr:ATP-binding protein [Myxococcota bacterium]